MPAYCINSTRLKSNNSWNNKKIVFQCAYAYAICMAKKLTNIYIPVFSSSKYMNVNSLQTKRSTITSVSIDEE